MKKQVRFSNIKWDTDGIDTDLPEALVMGVPFDDETDLSIEGADFLSDEYGHCVLSFDFEELDPVQAESPSMSM